MSFLEGYTPPYAATGPFTNGGAPGISAPFLTALEGFIYNTDQPPSQVLNGSTSGTATLYQMPWSVLKLIYINLNNFRNGGGNAQNITFPLAFTSALYLWTGDVDTFSLLLSGTAQTIRLLTGLASGGGSVTNVTSAGSFSQGQCGGCDTISFGGGQASAHGGPIVLLGV